jgi:hypothetical protein
LTVAVSVGTVAVGSFIPATLLIPGIGLPVVDAVRAGLALAAAVGIKGDAVTANIASVMLKKKDKPNA